MTRHNADAQSTIGIVRSFGVPLLLTLSVALAGCGEEDAASQAPLSQQQGSQDGGQPDGSVSHDAVQGDASAGVVDGSSVDGPNPPPRFLSLALGDAHACAIVPDGSVRCWGGVLASSGPSKRASALAAGGSNTCAILEDGSVTCWAPAHYPWNAANVSPDLGDHKAVKLAMGEQSWACAVLDDGSATCWNCDVIGSGTHATQTRLIPPDGSPPIRQLAVSFDDYTMALYEDGTLSDGLRLALSAGHLPGGSAAEILANRRGGVGWCSTLVGGGVYCQAGLGNLAPPPSTTLTALIMNDNFVCGLRPTGVVSCWTSPDATACDDSSQIKPYWCARGQRSDRSHDVDLGGKAVALASGTTRSRVACAILDDGTAKCWAPVSCPSSDSCQAILKSSVDESTGIWGKVTLD
jgi:hypothetical protein